MLLSRLRPAIEHVYTKNAAHLLECHPPVLIPAGAVARLRC